MKPSAKTGIVVVLIILVGVILAAKNGWLSGSSMSDTSSDTPAVHSFADTSVIGKGKPVLLELGADKCVPCKMMVPVLEELSEQYRQQFTVAFHDVWKDPAPAEKYNLNIIPTQIFFDKDGKELYRHEGFFAKEDILAKWKELGVQ
jgi:thioredoxin 1